MLKALARAVAIALLPSAFFLWVGFRAIDFGYHWDEANMLQRVQRAALNGTLLPGAYRYPSVSFWLALAGLAPDAVRDWRAEGRTPRSAALVAVAGEQAYQLRVRRIFVVVTGLGVVLTAGLSLALGGAAAEALLAALILATSWEVGYHARWIAPDGVLMTCVTVALVAIALALNADLIPRKPDLGTAFHRHALRAAAIATGLALGTKYTAWPLLVTLVAAVWSSARIAAARERGIRAASLLGLAFVVYLATTPGTVIQPGPFVRDVLDEVAHYATGHGGHSVARGPVHLWRIGVYLSAVQLAPYVAVALAWSALAVAGAADYWRRSRQTALVMAIFPVVYILWFATQRVMIVRNLVLLAPILAVLAAHGGATLWRALGARPSLRFLRPALAIGMASAIAAAAVFDVRAADSIRRRAETNLVAEFGEWLHAHPGDAVVVSAKLVADLKRAGMPLPSPVEGRPTAVAFYASEQEDGPAVESNHLGLFEAVLGPSDANFDYYTDWAGNEHILVLAAATADQMGFRVR